MGMKDAYALCSLNTKSFLLCSSIPSLDQHASSLSQLRAMSYLCIKCCVKCRVCISATTFEPKQLKC